MERTTQELKRTLVVYSNKPGSRLNFVLNWLFKENYSIDYKLVHDEAEVKDLPFFISYGTSFPNALSVPDAELLWQTGIAEHHIATGTWNILPTLYAKPGGDYTIVFDIFSAIFFLLSRYEEYYPYKADKHERYPATESVLKKNGWLQRPLIDEWLFMFRQLLQQRAGFEIEMQPFTYQPTYDIDIAYAYLYKGWKRTDGAYLRNLFTGNFNVLRERWLVRDGKIKDPYDSFDWIIDLHKNATTKPIYFILAALNNSKFDRNLLPDNAYMQMVMKKLSKNGEIGLHPSYYSGLEDTFRREKNLVEVIIGHPIRRSRQHYIRVILPDTYRLLLTNRVDTDYSMGYGTHLGFRAGTGRPFNWYDIMNEKEQALRIVPFCFMDTTALFGERLNAAEAFNKLREMATILKATNSRLVTIFHNFSLGTAREWKGWKEAYDSFAKSNQQ
jgi:hypothetical protein